MARAWRIPSRPGERPRGRRLVAPARDPPPDGGVPPRRGQTDRERLGRASGNPALRGGPIPPEARAALGLEARRQSLGRVFRLRAQGAPRPDPEALVVRDAIYPRSAASDHESGARTPRCPRGSGLPPTPPCEALIRAPCGGSAGTQAQPSYSTSSYI